MPSNQRAPSNTVEPSHMAWERGPMIATLPSYQSPSTKVHVVEGAGTASVMPVSLGFSGAKQEYLRTASVNRLVGGIR